jgi:hypothetical protein
LQGEISLQHFADNPVYHVADNPDREFSSSYELLADAVEDDKLTTSTAASPL